MNDYNEFSWPKMVALIVGGILLGLFLYAAATGWPLHLPQCHNETIVSVVQSKEFIPSHPVGLIPLNLNGFTIYHTMFAPNRWVVTLVDGTDHGITEEQYNTINVGDQFAYIHEVCK